MANPLMGILIILVVLVIGIGIIFLIYNLLIKEEPQTKKVYQKERLAGVVKTKISFRWFIDSPLSWKIILISFAIVLIIAVFDLNGIKLGNFSNFLYTVAMLIFIFGLIREYQIWHYGRMVSFPKNQKKKYVWECDYCGTSYPTKSACLKHEKTCSKNKK